MKRLVLCLLMAGILLSACSGNATPEVTVPSVTETTAQTEPISLLSSAQPIGDNIWYLPNTAVESMFDPQLWLFQDDLLVSRLVITPTCSRLDLKRISLADGSVVGEASFESEGNLTLQAGEDSIGLCDSASGNIQILDEWLNLSDTYAVSPDYANWYLSPDLKTLYILDYDRGITARDLATGGETQILSDVTCLSILGDADTGAVFTYIDLQDQMTKCLYLDFSHGALSPLPEKVTTGSVSHAGDAWLLHDWSEPGSYRVITGQQAHQVSLERSQLLLLSPQCHLLAIDESSRSLTLYDAEGTYLSQCSLPEGKANGVGQSFVWSPTHQGYFFTDFQDGVSKLLFWDPSIETAGESLPMEAVVREEKIPLEDAQLQQRADALSERFDLDIRLGSQCQLVYEGHTAYALEDPAAVNGALDILEQTLSRYPEGFFTQLQRGTIDTIRIEIVGNLSADAAFAHEVGDCHWIVMDAYVLSPYVVYHEFSHLIDRRLEWDATLRSDALFSEEAWLALQPEGFDYAYSYDVIPESVTAYYGSGYFVYDYGCTWPTEDRATLLGAAMDGDAYLFQVQPALQRKLEYYSRCIRDCFNTDGWPEVTAWEAVLQ